MQTIRPLPAIVQPEPFLRILTDPRFQTLIDLIRDILDRFFFGEPFVRCDRIADDDLKAERPRLVDQRRHDRQLAEHRKMRRPCRSQCFLPEEIRQDPRISGVLIAQKSHEVSFLQPTQHITDSRLILDSLPRHRAIFTEETVKLFIILLHGDRKQRIAIERKRCPFDFPVAAVRRRQDAAFPFCLDRIQLFLPSNGHVFGDILLRKQRKAEHRDTQRPETDSRGLRDALCFLLVLSKARAQQIRYRKSFSSRRYQQPEKFPQSVPCFHSIFFRKPTAKSTERLEQSIGSFHRMPLSWIISETSCPHPRWPDYAMDSVCKTAIVAAPYNNIRRRHG